jgi:hypothetical protein
MKHSLILEINDFIAQSAAVVGYLPELPTESTIIALKNLDYGSGIILPEFSASNLTDEEEEELELIEGPGSLGGYAIDMLSMNSFRDFKTMFNAIIFAEASHDMLESGFLVRIVIQPTGIVALECIVFDADSAEAGIGSSGFYFDLFRKVLKNEETSRHAKFRTLANRNTVFDAPVVRYTAVEKSAHDGFDIFDVDGLIGTATDREQANKILAALNA